MVNLMTNKHTKMFNAWYEDNVLSHWKVKKVGDNKYVHEKVKHVTSRATDRLGKEWEHERIWND